MYESQQEKISASSEMRLLSSEATKLIPTRYIRARHLAHSPRRVATRTERLCVTGLWLLRICVGLRLRESALHRLVVRKIIVILMWRGLAIGVP